LSRSLKPGQRYIVDSEDRTIFMRVRMSLQPLQAGERLSDYFELNSDPQNWDKSDAETFALQVHAIFAK